MPILYPLRSHPLRRGGWGSHLLFRRDVYNHTLALQLGHCLHLAVLLEVVRKARQQQLTLLLEQDATPAEEYIRLHLVAFLQELLRVLEFEIIVVVISLRSETYLLDYHFRRVRFLLLLLALLLIEELLIVQHTANGRYRVWRNLYEIQVLRIRDVHSLLKRIDTLLYIVAHKAHFPHAAYLFVDAVGHFFLLAASTLRAILWICYSCILLLIFRAAKLLFFLQSTK